MVTIIKKIKLWPSSLRWRMIFTYFFIILLTLFLISVYILSSLKEYFYNREKVNLFTKANVVANVLSDREAVLEKEFELSLAELFYDKPPRIIVLDYQTIVLYDNDAVNSLKGKIFVMDTVIVALGGKDESNTYKSDEGVTFLEVAVPIIKNAQTMGVVYMRQSMREVDEFLAEIRYTLYFMALIINILIGILSGFIAGIITAPIQKIREVAQAIANGDFNQHVSISGSSEIAKLDEAFNTMSARLLELEQKRRIFVSDASHELKTPLSTIKLLSESLLQTDQPDPLMVKEFLGDINSEIDRLSRIIERLLTLTKTDSQRVKLVLETIEPASICEAIVKSLKPMAKEKLVELSYKCEVDDHFEMLADRDKLWEAIYNITSNAIKYTPEGGYVQVSFAVDLSNIIITVEDSGIGIPKEDTAKIFDRFYRVDTARARDTGGTGLGLSIALDAITLHNGHIEVLSEEGVGSKFIVIIPYTGK